MRPSQTERPVRPRTRLGVADLPVLLLALLATCLPLVPADIASPQWHGLKTLVFEVGASLLLLLSNVIGVGPPRPRGNVPSALRFLITPLGILALLLVWAAASFAFRPDKGFAFHGLWLMWGGAVVTGLVTLGARKQVSLALILDALNVAAVVIGGSAVALYLQAGMPVAEGNYHDHMLLGAALMILLPMTLACCVSSIPHGRKTLALAALVVCVPALLLAQTRSSWIGAVVALLAFGALWLWCGPRVKTPSGTQEPRSGRGQALVYGILVAVALGGFLLYAQQNGLFADRAKTLTTSVLEGKEASLEWRFSTWRGAAKMIEEKPLLGWGVGCYPLHQQPFTGTGEPPAVVAVNGPRIWDEAHNSYLQIAAELGVPGLILWLLVLGSATVCGVGILRRLPQGGVQQTVLIGSLSALTGQAVDALANPGWQFGEVAIYFWIVLGLVVGLSSNEQGGAEGSEARATEKLIWTCAARIAAASLMCVWAIYEAITNARLLPTPHL